MRINHIKSKNQCIFIHFWPFFTRFGLYFQFPGPRWLIYNNLPIWRIYLFHFLTFDKCGWDIYPDPQPHISAYAHHPSETVLFATAWPSLIWIYLKRDISKNISYMYVFLAKVDLHAFEICEFPWSMTLRDTEKDFLHCVNFPQGRLHSHLGAWPSTTMISREVMNHENFTLSC